MRIPSGLLSASSSGECTYLMSLTRAYRCLTTDDILNDIQYICQPFVFPADFWANWVEVDGVFSGFRLQLFNGLL
jgi:hypothetical protein